MSEGLYYTQVFAEGSHKLEGLKEGYRKKFNKEPGLLIFTALGYDGMYTIYEAMKLADSVDPIEINEAIYQIKNLEGATGKITFNENGSASKEEKIWKVEDGIEVLIK